MLSEIVFSSLFMPPLTFLLVGGGVSLLPPAIWHVESNEITYHPVCLMWKYLGCLYKRKTITHLIQWISTCSIILNPWILNFVSCSSLCQMTGSNYFSPFHISHILLFPPITFFSQPMDVIISYAHTWARSDISFFLSDTLDSIFCFLYNASKLLSCKFWKLQITSFSLCTL